MNLRLGYDVELEQDWPKVAQLKPNVPTTHSDVSWDKAALRDSGSCDSVGLGDSISTQAEVLATFVRIVDDKDSRTLAVAASRIRESELLAEARLRYALHQEPNSGLVPPVPNWFAVKREQLTSCLPTAVAVTGQLLTELALAIKLDDSIIDIEPGPDGSVVVALGHGCRWIVNPPRLPWPGCDVRFYAPENPNSLKLRVEHHRLMETLIEATVRRMNGNGR